MDTILKILSAANDQVDFAKEENLIDDGCINSLELMEIISELEDAFDIEISMEEIIPDNFNSAASILAMVNRLKS